MADVTAAAGSAAGVNTVSRPGGGPGGASGSSRVGALRPVSAVAPTAQSFAQSFAIARPAADEKPAPAKPEPGTGRLSSSVQLILAETRAQEDQSDFIDRSTLDHAANSYAQSEASVRETIGLAQIAAATAVARTEASDTSA